MAVWRVLGAALLWHGVIAQLSETAAAQEVAPRKLHGRFLHISDIHPDEFYRVHSSTDETEACHRGKGPAGTFGAETSDCDSPFALVNATFDWIAANLRNEIDFVVWTGDSARHDSDEEIPRSQAQVLGTNRWIADKFQELFADPAGRGLEIPIVPTLGNNDILPHNILLSGPNPWLQHYVKIWRRFIPEEQRHGFEFGGWFRVDVIPDRLAVFSLNTLYFFDRNAAVDGCAKPSEPGFKQLEWLRVQLQFVRQRGMKAILTGHVPPARTDSKQLWDETCWQKYTLWVEQFRDVIVAGLYGHMNIDHFLLHDAHDVNIASLSASADDIVHTREAMEDELSVESATDYLQELRSGWSKLNPPAALPGKPGKVKDDKTSKKKKKGHRGHKKVKDRWGERYQLSLVGPSLVPNYFPTLRVIEYNISGLENVPVWADRPEGSPAAEPGEENQKHLDLRDLPDFEEVNEKKKMKKPHKDKKPKDKKPKDPHLIIPDPPAKTSPPGPGYSLQPLSLTGYTQYYANITFINNMTLDARVDSSSESESTGSSWAEWFLLRWRNGKHRGTTPAAPKPQPREFSFEVEYSTFNDKIYRLRDLTVNSFVDLAYRMGQQVKGSDAGVDLGRWEDVEAEDLDLTQEEDEGEEDVETEGNTGTDKDKKKGKKGKKGKKKKKKKKQNKAWLHFLTHAFVGTVEKQELQKLG